ncbi:MAG: acyl-CoA thioesterase [Muribaculaceae bacterium]|nr:acyl-CoA thioesterase [Muribaculaceae bacterium]
MAYQLPKCKNQKVPAASCGFNHKMPLQVRFNDIDILGHINNSVYLSFLDLAKAEYLTTATSARVEIGGIAVAIVNISCSFFSPGYFNEPLEAVTAVTRVSHRSLCMEQRIYNPTTGDVKCIANTVMAGFDPRTAKGAEIPQEFIDELEAFEQRSLFVEKTMKSK